MRREFASALGIFIVLWNLVVGFAIAARPVATDGMGIPQIGVLCTSDGALSLAGDDAAGQPEQKPIHNPHCMFCVPLFQGGLLAPTSYVSVVLLRDAISVFFVSERPIEASSPGAALPRVRGPPALTND